MNEKINWSKEIYPYLTDEIINAIEKLPTSVFCNMTEIRLRAYGAVSISVGNENKVLYSNKKIITLSSVDIEKIFEKICDGAAYKFESQIKNGYITLYGGHRVGFCGTAVYEDNKLISLNNITSLSFRLSRQIKNAAKDVFPYIMSDNKIYSSVIVSEPCGGKTTMLTDIARIFSNIGIKCCVIDERGEICAVHNGKPQKDVGNLTDILNNYSKGEGMIIALRCLSPQVIICDEIGGVCDADAMLEAMNAGVPVITTAHASNECDFIERPQIERLIDHGAIDKIIFLKGSKFPGAIKKVITVNKYDKDYWNSNFID